MPKPDYIDIDRLQAETTLEEAAAKCGVKVEPRGSGKETRIDCPFACPGDHVGRREISINTEHPQKLFYCHAYICQVRGNLLALMHGWMTGRFQETRDGRLFDMQAETDVPLTLRDALGDDFFFNAVGVTVKMAPGLRVDNADLQEVARLPLIISAFVMRLAGQRYPLETRSGSGGGGGGGGGRKRELPSMTDGSV